jgi:hypothetical protein
MPCGCASHLGRQSELQFLCPTHGTQGDDSQAGGCHGPCQYVQTFLPTLRETAPGEVDMVDEEGGETDLLAVRLLLWPENQPEKILMRQCADAWLLLQSSRAGCCHLC